MTFASIISLSRIFLIVPILFFCSYSDMTFNIIGILIYITACLTDFFDGYVARRTKTVTDIGALCDLIADKLFVCILLAWIIFSYKEFLLFIPCMLIISRELIISSLRQHLATTTQKKLRVSKSGKLKTTMQMIAVGFLLLGHLDNNIYFVGLILIWLSTFLSFQSLYSYRTQLR